MLEALTIFALAFAGAYLGAAFRWPRVMPTAADPLGQRHYLATLWPPLRYIKHTGPTISAMDPLGDYDTTIERRGVLLFGHLRICKSWAHGRRPAPVSRSIRWVR